MKKDNKITWTEIYTHSIGYSAIITKQQAQLFKTDPNQFFNEVHLDQIQQKQWDTIYSTQTTNYKIQ